MTDTVYLHIGYGRCGSSSLQEFAAEQRTELARRGVAYPDSLQLGLPESRGGANALEIVQSFRRGNRGVADEVADRLAELPSGAVLLSSEFLLESPEPLRRSLHAAVTARGMRLVAIVYVREQREFLISRYAQAVKSSKRWTVSLADYIAERYTARQLDYTGMLRGAADVFGRENVVVRVYQRDRLYSQDIRADIFHTIGVEVDDLIASAEPTINASAPAEQVEAMRLLNELAGSHGFNPRRFLRFANREFPEGPWRPAKELYRLVSPETMTEIGEYFAQRNEAFRAEFLPDLPGPIFTSSIPDEYETITLDDLVSHRLLTLVTRYLVETPDRAREAVESAANPGVHVAS